LPLFVSSALSQTRIENTVRQLSAENARGYLQPFVDDLGANMNAGLYHTAEIEDLAFHLQIQVVAMAVRVEDADKLYRGVPPPPNSQTAVETATVFGEHGASVTDPNSSDAYHFPGGELKTSILPYAAPQLILGNILGTQALFRYLVMSRRHDVPAIHMVGFGVRHSLSRYAPKFPVDLSVGLFTQRVKIGDILETNAFTVGGQFSKSWFIFTLYGCVEYEKSTTSVNYIGGPSDVNMNVSFEMEGKNHLSVGGGLGIDLFILHVSAGVSTGQLTVGSAAVGLGN
jgi:hypothetical protein